MVVGASSGIGRALARHLATGGCRVAALARREERLRELARETEEAGAPGEVVPLVHDVRDRAAVPGVFDAVERELGGLPELVVYAAGLMPPVGPREYDPEQDARIVEVNLLGAMAWLDEAAVRLGGAGTGTLVGIGSVAGDRGRRGNPAYAASKAALATFLESLRNRLAQQGLTVVTVKPGPVDTEMTRELEDLPMMISAERAAELVARAARRGRPVAYVPARWRVVSWMLRAIPSPIFRRLDI